MSQTSFAVRDWRESLHARAGVFCSACHGTHEAGFVPEPGPAQCLGCHAREVEQFLASKHGPARSPGMRCFSCHEAHATDRGLPRSGPLCGGCHRGSDHVQGFPASRMGQVRAQPAAAGEPRAPDCVTCHMPPDSLMRHTGDFRNDRVTLHDPAITVEKNPSDPRHLSRASIEFLLPVCESCHSERNSRYRLEHSDPLIRHWTPVDMPDGVRDRPAAAAAVTGSGR